MKEEISIAVDLLIAYIQRYGSIKNETIEQLRQQLETVLLKRYEGHWYPDKPIKGQAYRSLEFNKENQFCDTIIAQLCRQLGFTPDLLGIHHELTLWVDPCEVSIRLGNHVCPKGNQQLIVARFDTQGTKLFHHDLDSLFSQSRLPIPDKSPRSSPPPPPVLPVSQPSMFRNGPLFTPPRALSPQAPVFQMASSTPINVPLQSHPLENSIESSDENSYSDDTHSQPERSDTPHSMNSTTSNESTDSGYCGYVESYPYYYKLNRMYKLLAMQKHTGPESTNEPKCSSSSSFELSSTTKGNSCLIATHSHTLQHRSTSPPSTLNNHSFPLPIANRSIKPLYTDSSRFPAGNSSNSNVHLLVNFSRV